MVLSIQYHMDHEVRSKTNFDDYKGDQMNTQTRPATRPTKTEGNKPKQSTIASSKWEEQQRAY